MRVLDSRKPGEVRVPCDARPYFLASGRKGERGKGGKGTYAGEKTLSRSMEGWEDIAGLYKLLPLLLVGCKRKC